MPKSRNAVSTSPKKIEKKAVTKTATLSKVTTLSKANGSKSNGSKPKPVLSTVRTDANKTPKSNSMESPQTPNAPSLTDGEINVLGVFRTYLMTPGKMLCLSNTDIGSMKKSLERLISVGMLLPESFKGGYSLTRLGFQTMKGLSVPASGKR